MACTWVSRRFSNRSIVSGSQDAVQRPIPDSRSIQLFNRTARRCRSNRSRPSPSDSRRRASSAHAAGELFRCRGFGEQHQPGSISRQLVADTRRSLSQDPCQDIDMIARDPSRVERVLEPGHLRDGLGTMQDLFGLADAGPRRRQPTISRGTTTPSPTRERQRPRGLRPTTSTGATHQPQPRAPAGQRSRHRPPPPARPTRAPRPTPSTHYDKGV